MIPVAKDEPKWKCKEEGHDRMPIIPSPFEEYFINFNTLDKFDKICGGQRLFQHGFYV